MAYRRRQHPNANAHPAASSFEDDDPISNSAPLSTSIPSSDFAADDWYFSSSSSASSSSSSSSSSSLAAKAIRASSAYRDSALSSAYASHRPISPSTNNASRYTNVNLNPNPREAKVYEYTPMKDLSEPKQGFWNSLARKAKSIIDDDDNNEPRPLDPPPPQLPGRTTQAQIPSAATTRANVRLQYPAPESPVRRAENPSFQKGFSALTSSINYIGGRIGNALEEGITIVENRTADVIQETRKHIKKKNVGSEPMNQAQNSSQPQMQTDLQLQLKASRDVAMAMAAKAKLLLRELKTVKADLAFAKERCAQLEEENKILRENRDNPEDDDLIRLQLETLLAEKARLAHENSVYARENRFLREVVEYHQLTMQDVVYLDEGSEEVTEVYPMKVMAGNPEVRGVSKGGGAT